MKTTTEDRGLVAPGSLFNTSEGLLSTTLTGLVATVVTAEGYSETLKMVAIGGLAIALAAYNISRALVKKNA
jgi:hypothetical protein